MAGPITCRVNVATIRRILQDFPREAAEHLDPWFEKQVRTLVSSSGKVPGLVQVTPPYGNGMKSIEAKKQGEAAVTRDIWKVYGSPSRVYELLRSYAGGAAAAKWWKLWKTSPLKAADWLESSSPSAIQSMKLGFDGGGEHQKWRGRNGRVNSEKPKRIVLFDVPEVRRYTKERMKFVGLLASSVPSAVGSRFGKLSGVPAWVSRHNSRYGYMQDQRSRGKRTVTLGIRNRAIKEMQRRFSYVLRYREQAMVREMSFVARALERKLRGRLAAA